MNVGLRGMGIRLRTLLSAGADLLYPRVCPVCGSEPLGRGMHICWDCLANIQYIHDPYCSRCGDPVYGAVYHRFECTWCRDTKPAFVKARSAVRFRGGIRQMLHGFKYSNQIFLSVELGALLAGCVQAHYGDIDFDAVVSVPLHRRKWRERSYNQAEVLARELARTRKIDLIKNALCRNRFTPSQTNLSASERLLNVRNAFVVLQPDWVSERRILLVDDVMTTGATVNECAKVLMQAGAISVHVATVARG